jgi:hypothetical protein
MAGTFPLLNGAPLVGGNPYYQATAAGINPYFMMMDAANMNNFNVMMTISGHPVVNQNLPQIPEFKNIAQFPTFPAFLPGIPLPPGVGQSGGITFGFPGFGQQPILQRPFSNFGLSPTLNLPQGFNVNSVLPLNPISFGGFSAPLIPTPTQAPFATTQNLPANTFFNPLGFSQTQGFPTFTNGNFIPFTTAGVQGAGILGNNTLGFA